MNQLKLFETSCFWEAAIHGRYGGRGANFHDKLCITNVIFQICSCKFNQNETK